MQTNASRLPAVHHHRAIERTQAGAARYERFAVWFCAAVAVALVLIGTLRYGLTLNVDGVGYKATADSLVAGHGLGWWGDPNFVTWPPLLPMLLALGEWLSPWEADTVALGMNVVCVGVIVFESSLLLRAAVRRPWVRVVGLSIVAVAPAVIEVHRMLYTEPLFIALSLGALLAFDRAVHETVDWRWLAVAVVLVWLAYLTRYIGAALAVSGAISLLWLPRAVPFRRRLVTGASFGAVGLVVPALWTLRNATVGGAALQNHGGTNGDVAGSLSGAVGDSLRGVGQWVFWWAGPLQLPIGVLAGVFFATIGVVLWRRRHVPPVVGDDAERLSRLVPLVAYVGVSLAVLISFRGVVAFGSTFARYLVPLFIPLLVIALGGIEAVADRSASRGRRSLLLVTGVAVAAWSVVLGLTSLKFSYQHLSNGALYTSKQYRQADLPGVVADARLSGCSVYSDQPAGVFLWTGIVPDLSPRRSEPLTSKAVGDVGQLQAVVDREPVCLVWVEFDPYEQVLTLDDLRKSFDLVPVLSRNGISVYNVKARSN